MITLDEVLKEVEELNNRALSKNNLMLPFRSRTLLPKLAKACDYLRDRLICTEAYADREYLGRNYEQFEQIVDKEINQILNEDPD